MIGHPAAEETDAAQNGRMRRLLMVCVLGLSGCLPHYDYPDVELPDAGDGTLPSDVVEISSDDVEAYALCGAGGVRMSEDLVVAATVALRDLSDGETETRLSDDGCIRFRRTMAGGVPTSAEFRIFSGVVDYAFRDGEPVFGAHYVTMARWERDASGTLNGTIDADESRADRGDDFFEVRTVERPGYYRVTGYNPASREIEWQLTQDRTSATQVTEALVEGTLGVVDTTVIGTENEEACADGAGCFEMATSCSAAQVTRLEDSMARALARGTSCMAGVNNGPDGTPGPETETWQRLQALKNLWTSRHEWACMPPGCGCAHWSEGGGAGGIDRIEIGFDDWTARAPEMQLGTLFHEFMHGVVGAHLDVAINGTLPEGRQGTLMRRYVDRVDACEAYCFSPTPTRCACATCLDRRTCDQPCAGLASCTEYAPAPDGSGVIAIMSEAVGAACVTTITVNGHEEESAAWSTTMAACRATCAASGGTCRSYNRSCEPGCE